MDYKVIWTDEAIADLRQLVVFISKHNPDAAVKFGETIVRKSLILSSHPRLGRRLKMSPTDLMREVGISPYRMVYEIDDQARVIYIRLLWHGSRQEPEF